MKKRIVIEMEEEMYNEINRVVKKADMTRNVFLKIILAEKLEALKKNNL